MIRKWVLTEFCLPKEDQKVYYFCKSLGIFRGEYHYIDSSYANPHKFSSNHGVLDADDVSYWMPYYEEYKDIIPLPPDYDTEQPFVVGYDKITIPETTTKYSVTASDVFWE